MSDQNFSLCIPQLNFNDNKIHNLIWRVADYIPEDKVFIEVKNNLEDVTDYLKDKISANPNILEAYKAEIFSWHSDENNKIWSEKYENHLPIEILKANEISIESYNSDFKIRELLHNGIYISENIDRDFLIIINEIEYMYEVLYFNKKNFSKTAEGYYKIQQTPQDMRRTIHSVKLFNINKSDIIDTSHLNIRISTYEESPIRYFYKYTDLPKVITMFCLRELQDYAKVFVSKYVRSKSEVLVLSKKEIQKLTSIISTTLEDKEEINTFFKETGLNLNDVEDSLREISEDVAALFIGSNKFAEIVEDCLLRAPNLKNEYINQARNIWFAEAGEERETIERNLDKYTLKLEESKQKYDDLLQSIQESTVEISNYKKEKKQLKKEFEESNVELLKVNTNIKSELELFQKDVVHLAAMSALSMGNNKYENCESSFIHLGGVKFTTYEETESENIVDLTEDLSDNLQISGVLAECSYNLSQIIISSIISEKHFIFCGQCEGIANALSAVVIGMSADQLFITSGLIDVASIINKINAIENNIILLYCALETYSENLFIAISKLCKGKVVIFSCEDEQTFSTLPSHWINYATFINVDNVLDFPKKENFISSSLDFHLFKMVKPVEKISPEIRKFIKIKVDAGHIARNQSLAYMQLLSVCSENYGDFKNIVPLLLKDNSDISVD